MCIMFMLLHMHIHHSSNTMAFTCQMWVSRLYVYARGVRTRSKDRQICVTCAFLVITHYSQKERHPQTGNNGKICLICFRFLSCAFWSVSTTKTVADGWVNSPQAWSIDENYTHFHQHWRSHFLADSCRHSGMHTKLRAHVHLSALSPIPVFASAPAEGMITKNTFVYVIHLIANEWKIQNAVEAHRVRLKQKKLHESQASNE